VSDRIASRLLDAGMSSEEAIRKATRFAELTASMQAFASGAGAISEPRALWVPGRLEVLGKHTDYAGGRSLLCAVERGLCVLVSARDDDRIRVRDARSGETIIGALDPELVPAAGHWSNYPMTVARRIARDFPGAARGADIVFASDLPPAAGLSSSSALIVAVFLALSHVNDLAQRAEYRRSVGRLEDLADYLGSVESGRGFGALAGDVGVGTLGGSEDHTAILCAHASALVQYSFHPVRFERVVALPEGYRFVIAASGVVAEKTGAARERYNRASRAMEAILTRWRQATGRDDATVAAAITSSADAVDRMRACLREGGDDTFPRQLLLDRLEHFLVESEEIVPAVAAAIERHDLGRAGALVDRSQRGAERWLANQIPETMALARNARELGAEAASAFGAGFGGSVWALVREDRAEEFRDRWLASYAAGSPGPAGRATAFVTSAGPAAAWV
jgi:galactokinase